MSGIEEIDVMKTKMRIVLEYGDQLIGYVLKMDVINNLMEFLQDGSLESIKFPLTSVIRVEEVEGRLQ